MSLRRVAIIGGNRIPFARANGAYATASNQTMLTAALEGLIERYNLHGLRMGEVVAGAVLKDSRDFSLTRECVLGSRLSPQTPAYDLQQVCGTGLEAALLVGNQKNDGLLSLQARSEGPVPLLTIECTSEREIRGLARFDPEQIAPDATLADLLPDGLLAITVVPKVGERSQGFVDLDGETLARPRISRSLVHSMVNSGTGPSERACRLSKPSFFWLPTSNAAAAINSPSNCWTGAG